MRLESALGSSREGIITHGSAIAVTGDNISNSNTTAYKASRVEFADLMAEGYEGRQSETQVCGSGVMVGCVRTLQTQGTIEATGRSLDAAIEGAGYFMVGDPSDIYYTRNGTFQMAADGILETSDGLAVLGFQGRETSGTLGKINLLNVNTSGQATSTATLYGNNDASVSIITAPSNPATFKELAKAASNISVIEVYDSLGQIHSVTIASSKTAANTWNIQAYIDDGEISGGSAGTPRLLGEINLSFGSDGIIPEASKAAAAITINNVQFANGATGSSSGSMKIDLSNYTQYASPSSLTGIAIDGQGAGQVKDYEISSDGKVLAILSTGEAVVVGTIQTAAFTNVDGLERAGNSLFYATNSVGEIITGKPGSGALGTLAGASLEMSTVDIANEFIDLVVYQRGYQANSQVLSLASQMVKDTIGIMR